MRFTASLCAIFVLAASAAAQVELNSPGGTLQSNGVDPVLGTPFLVPSAGGVFDVEVSGNANAPYILALGTLLNPGLQIPVLGNQVLHLDQAQPIFVIGDGIAGSGLLPAFFFNTGPTGTSQFQFPAGSLAPGASLTFQAFVFDPTQPINLNITAAAEYVVTNAIVTNVIPLMTPTFPPFPAADEGFYTHTLAGGPVNFYGQSVSQITISSNGWIRFDGDVTDADLAPDITAFLGGGVGFPNFAAAPAIAAVWDDLDLSVGPGQIVLIEDVGNSTVTVQWLNGDYYAGGFFGDVTVTMDFSSLAPIVTLDYTNFVGSSGFTFVGISDGDLGGALGADVEADLVVGGAVAPYAAANDFLSYFQDFGGSGTLPPETEDLGGKIFTIVDSSATGSGQFVIF
jgi:hypothetical protein